MSIELLGAPAPTAGISSVSPIFPDATFNGYSLVGLGGAGTTLSLLFNGSVVAQTTDAEMEPISSVLAADGAEIREIVPHGVLPNIYYLHTVAENGTSGSAGVFTVEMTPEGNFTVLDQDTFFGASDGVSFTPLNVVEQTVTLGQTKEPASGILVFTHTTATVFDDAPFVLGFLEPGPSGGFGITTETVDYVSVVTSNPDTGDTITVTRTYDASQGAPIVTQLSDGGFALVYGENGSLNIQRFDAFGVQTGSDQILSSSATGALAPVTVDETLGGTLEIVYEASAGPQFVTEYKLTGTKAPVIAMPSMLALDPGQTLDGTSGDDFLRGGAGDDTINGLDGNDTLIGNDGDDVINGGRGADRIQGRDGDDTLNGGEDDDTIKGGDGEDEIDGGSGNDDLEGGAGDDEIIGGYGNDDIDGGADDDMLEGNDGDDLIRGGDGTDSLNGGRGNDDLRGGDGNDTIVGDRGNDILSGNDGNDLMFGDAGQDLMSGGDGNDEMHGGGNHDTMYGDAGSDVMYGDAGTDTMFGDEGADEMYGGSGQDTISGGSGNDTVYGGTGNDLLTGGNGVDELYGEAGNDNLRGNDGIDFLYGGAGFDTLEGGLNNDFLYGGNGADQLLGGMGNDELNGDGSNDDLYGHDGNDVLNGGTGNDGLRGGAGNDVLNGGAGRNFYFGGDGADQFLFGDTGSRQTVYDFVDGEDMLVLQGAGAGLIYEDLRILQLGADTRIDANGFQILLQDTDISTISEDDFIFT